MAHEITELKDTVLRNPPWYHETGAEEFQIWQESSPGETLTLGVMVLIQIQSLEA